MKKRKTDVWIAQVKNLMQALRFSTLDAESQTCVNSEIFYFNNSRLLAISWVIMVLETLNAVNVLFFSKSGLGTLNNRQHFAMYLLLLVSGAACLVLRQCLHNKPKILQRCYVGFTFFWLMWHAQVSAMDLRRNPSITVFITGIFALSLLVRLKPRETLTIMPGGLLILLLCARNTMTSGIATNAAIVTLVAVLISCSRYFSTLEELGYRRKMILQANHRTEEKQMRELLCNQQEVLLQHSGELLFLWEKKADRLVLAGGRTLCSADRNELLTWLAQCERRQEGIVRLRLEQEHPPLDYQIACTPQFYGDDMLIGAVGRIEHTNKKGE